MTTSSGTNEADFGTSMALKICSGYMALGAWGISVVFASGDMSSSTSIRTGGVRGGHDNSTFCDVTDFIPVFPADCPFVTSVGSTGAAIDAFLTTIPADFPGTFNKTERAYPDVATQSGAIIAVINDRLLAAGKPTLGFLNPFIYLKVSSAFIDITTGHNSDVICSASSVAFNAAVGWDSLNSLAGFGTPIFSKLLAAAMEY
ncbi:hypothetical protein C8R44DRAFT_862605 [Mycena epipterygia]|nr:hypothetical protein C8R44DRAFT_862605 [Mycena epipterygia]